MRISITFAIFFAATVSLVRADPPKPVTFEIENKLATARGATLVSHPIELAGQVALLDAAGKELPCHYDAKAKRLLFMDTFAAGEKKNYSVAARAPKARVPAWKAKTGKEQDLKLEKKTLKGMNAEIENGLLRVKLFRNKEVRTEVEVSSPGGGYKFRVCPLGSSVGCIDDAKIADDLEKHMGKPHPEVFVIYHGYPEKVRVEEVNPFQRRIVAECVPWGRKNGGGEVKHMTAASIEVTLTANSPVIEIRSKRTVATKYYNHNGVFLNDIFMTLPVKVQTEKTDALADLNIAEGGKVRTVESKEWLLLNDGAKSPSQTLVYQPTFKDLGVEGPCVVAFADRVSTIISQSWHQGWKPIEIAARDYEDRMLLVCDPAWATAKEPRAPKDWIAELDSPLW